MSAQFIEQTPLEAPPSDRAQFLAERRRSLGGSDIGAILGVDQYRSPLDVWNDKTGTVVHGDFGNQHTKRGIRLEQEAANEFTDLTGKKLRRHNQTYVHPNFPFLTGNVDRIVVGENGAIAEIKCPSLGMFSKIKRTGVIPASWMVQLQWYLFLSGADHGYWIIFCADQWELVHFKIIADALLQSELEKRAIDFWNLVETRTPPPALEIDKAQLEFQAGESTIIKRDDPEFLEAVEMLRTAKECAEEGETLLALAKDRIKQIVGAKGKYEGGGARINWFESPGRKTFDKKALAAACPVDRVKVMELISRPELHELFNEFLRTDLALDLSKFEKQGKPFETFVPYLNLRGEK